MATPITELSDNVLETSIPELRILELPDNVLETILANLGLTDLLCAVPYTCKRLQRVSNSPNIWSVIHHRNVSDEKFYHVFDNYQVFMNYKMIRYPCDKKQVISYLQCSYCSKYWLDSKCINHCVKCGYQTCIRCQKKIGSYQSKCIGCIKNYITKCGSCQEIISSGTYRLTDCCQIKVCFLCVNDHQQFKIKHQQSAVGQLTNQTSNQISVICRKHSYSCELCGQWSLKKMVSVCCHRIVCDTCVTFCNGCHEYHCIDHSQHNRCIMPGCCFKGNTDNYVCPTNSCVYNGSICTDCHEQVASTEMICHPVKEQRTKYCFSCFRIKQWICQYCRKMVPLGNIKSCDVCQQSLCLSHMYYLYRGGRYICQTCYHGMMGMCDLCQDIYNFTELRMDGNLKYCQQCEKVYIQ